MGEAKKFAIVKFTDEDDAPGIIPLSWLADDSSMCYYPEAKTDQMRERLIKDAVSPLNKAYTWASCKVHVMHFYSTFALARKNLKRAEETSDLDTGPDISEERPRRKIKKKNVLLPGEEAGDEGSGPAEIGRQNHGKWLPLVHQHSSAALPPFPQPNSFHASFAGSSLLFPHSSLPSSDNFCDAPCVSSPTNFPQSAQHAPITPFSSYNPPLTHNLTDISKNCFTPFQNESYVTEPPNPSKPSSPSAYSNSPSTDSPLGFTHTTIQEDRYHSSDLAKEDKKWAAVLQWMADISRRLEQIEDRLAATAQINLPIEEEDTSIFGLLPLKFLDDFIKLDDALKRSKPLTNKMIRILKSVGGKNANALLCNMMRRIMEDNVADVYNLSGTSTKRAGRRAFASTQLCNSVLEACRTVYKDITDHEMRKCIGDWLNQAHTRIVRSCRPVS